jgi:hypothetical protein
MLYIKQKVEEFRKLKNKNSGDIGWCCSSCRESVEDFLTKVYTIARENTLKEVHTKLVKLSDDQHVFGQRRRVYLDDINNLLESLSSLKEE